MTVACNVFIVKNQTQMKLKSTNWQTAMFMLALAGFSCYAQSARRRKSRVSRPCAQMRLAPNKDIRPNQSVRKATVGASAIVPGPDDFGEK